MSFTNNERVLCYHGPLLYEAKVLKTETWDDSTTKIPNSTGVHYFVHYKGWKNTWDEWVPQSRLLKFNEVNVARSKEIIAAHKATNPPIKPANASSGGPGPRLSSMSERRKESRGVKRARDEDERKPEMRLFVPDLLKVQLVDDWEAVTKNSQLVALPRSPSARQILIEFQSKLLAERGPSSTTTLFPELLAGLTLYFNRSLGQNLLYRFERAQYAEARKKYELGQEQGLAEVYGAEHLLRMIVNMPTMVAQTSLDQESIRLLADHLNELLKYMTQEREKLFMAEYDNASLPYMNIYRT